jgi:DNA primase
MLNPYQKKKFSATTALPEKPLFEKLKPEDKPNIITVFEHFDTQNQQLRNSGKAKLACCPFHGENHPSFAMYEETNTYHCFACGETGDSIKFIMVEENLNFTQAVQYARNNNLYDN